MTTILFSDTEDAWPTWQPALTAALSGRGIDAQLHRSPPTPEAVDFIVYSPAGGLTDFAPFTGLRAVFSTWAGVEKIVSNPTLTVPLTRMVDPGLQAGMVQYVTGHVLRHHLNIDAHMQSQDGTWRPDLLPALARGRRVGILGLGALGVACGRALAALDFNVLGWTRRPRDVPGITCHHGEGGLDTVLAAADFLVLLLPLTPETRDLIDAARLARLPRGAFVINPGRGPLIVDADLIAALDSGQVRHATLDVFREEPLPAVHPFWHHPKVTVTPHIAAETRADTAAEVIADNVGRALDGAPLRHLVDRLAGY